MKWENTSVYLISLMCLSMPLFSLYLIVCYSFQNFYLAFSLFLHFLTAFSFAVHWVLRATVLNTLLTFIQTLGRIFFFNHKSIMQLLITQVYIKLQNSIQYKYYDSHNKWSWLTPFPLQVVTQWTAGQWWKKCSDLVRQRSNATV